MLEAHPSGIFAIGYLCWLHYC